MIESFVLFAVLFAAASLGWGYLFHAEKSHLSGRVFLAALFFVTISGVFASVFFLKGLAEAGYNVTLVISSMVFALSFVVSLVLGFELTRTSEIAPVFSKVDEVWSGDKEEKDRSEIVNEIQERITKTGKLDAFEKELIGSILRFSDKIVREVMIPRGDIVAINIEEEPRRVLRRVAEEGYSRMPVYSGSLDNIVGIIYAKDLITLAEGSGAIVLQDLLRTPYYVPESKKISQLLREMQMNKVHLAVVVDEFGGTEGIVTLEDVLEEIVGEIQDEYDESLSEVIRDESGDAHFSGSMTVDRFNELLGCEIPREEDYDTMAGFVQKLAGKIPQKGEVYNHDEMFFIIEEVARHRVKRLKVSFKEHPQLAPVREVAGRQPTLEDLPLPDQGGVRPGTEAAVKRPVKAAAKNRVKKKSASTKQEKTAAGPARRSRRKR